MSVNQPFRHASASFRRVALVIFGVSLILRLAHLRSMRDSPFLAALLGDAASYDAWARQIASGDWIGHDVFYQAPLYAYFLAAIYSINPSLTVVRLCQAVVGASACVLLGYAAQRLYGPRAGLVAGLLLGGYAPALFFDGLLQKSVLDLFFVCLLLAVLSGAIVDPLLLARRARCLGVGVILGLLALTRENALVFVPVVIGWVWLQPTEIRRHALQRSALILAGSSIVLLPVALRNRVIGSEFHLTTTQSGPNFFIGNNPRADGTYIALRAGRGSPEYERTDAKDLAERAVGHALTPGEVSSFWTNRAIDYIRAAPMDWIALEGRKLRLLLNAAEVIDTESQESHADYSPVLRFLGSIDHFGLLLPLACVGAWITWRKQRPVGLLLAMACAYALSVIAFYVVARYRLPLVPFLILFAAAGLGRRRPFVVTMPPGSTALLGAVGVMAVALFCNVRVMSADSMRAVSYHNLGAALQQRHDFSGAEAAYRRAVDLDPNYAPALNGLGSVLRSDGKLEEGIGYLETALRRDPGLEDASFNLANALALRGRFNEAILRYQELLRRRPEAVDFHANLGVALSGAGRLDEAIEQFRVAVALTPKAAKAHYNLGHALLTIGNVVEATQELSRAAEIDPADVSSRYELGNAYLVGDRLAEAAAAYRAAVRLAPQSVEAHNNLGIALGSLGNWDEAIAEFRLALEIDPTSREGQANLQSALAARLNGSRARP